MDRCDTNKLEWHNRKIRTRSNDGILISDLQVYPNVSSKTIPVVAQIKSSVSGKAEISVQGYLWNTAQNIAIPEQVINIDLKEGLETYKFDINVGNKHVLWSEFDPALYKVNFAIESQNIKDSYTIDFGLRDFSAKGTQFEINSLKTFLRGKHDACVFPLIGYPR